jgi:hypothetical protein
MFIYYSYSPYWFALKILPDSTCPNRPSRDESELVLLAHLDSDVKKVFVNDNEYQTMK